MVGPYLLLLAAVTLRQDVALRTGCETDDTVVGQAKTGMRADIRFALAASACYKVATEAGVGYVHATDLAGLEQFESGRAKASMTVETVKVSRPELERVERAVSVTLDPNGPLAAALKLIDANQPAAALASLDPLLKRTRQDPSALVVAGIAAWRGDDSPRALEYWKTSLDLHHDPNLQRLYERVERESAADRSQQKSIGMRVNLRYEGETVSPMMAREMLEALDSEYARISAELGCRTEERITAIVQSRAAYLKATGAAEWSAGQYDGRIRISLVDQAGVGPKTRRLFAHELVHACLSSLGRWPSWFHEGMAQKLSGDHLGQPAVAEIQTLARSHQLPKLEDLGQKWSNMSATQATVAYGLALHAVDRLTEDYSGYGIRNILANPAKFQEITTALNREFGSVP